MWGPPGQRPPTARYPPPIPKALPSPPRYLNPNLALAVSVDEGAAASDDDCVLAEQRGEWRTPAGERAASGGSRPGGRPAVERQESPEPRALLSLFPSRSKRYEEGIPLDGASAGGIGDAGGGDDAGGSDVHWEDGAANAEP